MSSPGKSLFWGALLGAALGVLLGLGLARVIWPAAAPLPTVTAPLPTATTLPTQPSAATSLLPTTVDTAETGHEQALLTIGALYALDGDLERARQRLAGLRLAEPGKALAALALRYAAAGSRQVATDLATLAAALGVEPGDLLAYVATATPTATAQPTATPLPPTATPTPPPPPTPTSLPLPSPTRRPATQVPPTAPPPPPAATPRPLEWDRRVDLLSPPVRLVEASVTPGQWYWRLVRLQWQSARDGGNTILYVQALNDKGQPAWGQQVIVENGGRTLLFTEPKAGQEYGVNFPMASTLNSYLVYIGGDLPSDRVTGLGLGEWLGSTDHTSFFLVFQRTKK